MDAIEYHQDTIDRAPLAGNVMVAVDAEAYQSADGYTARREDGLTPNGNPVGRRWVLRDVGGNWIDVDQYRRDLFDRNSLRAEC